MFLAHGGATSGHMCGEVCSGMRNIREIHILSAKAAIEAGADIVMTAYNTIDGVLCVASKEILTDLLRDELGFEGVVMTHGGGVLRARDVVRGVDFDDSSWDFVKKETTPKGEPRLCKVEPIVITEMRLPVDVKHYDRLPFAYETCASGAKPREGCVRDNVYVFDFGVNTAGVTKLKINGKRGQK